MHGPPAVEGEQRLLVAERPGAAATIDLLLEQRSDPRPVRDEATLPELCCAPNYVALAFVRAVTRPMG